MNVSLFDILYYSGMNMYAVSAIPEYLQTNTF